MQQKAVEQELKKETKAIEGVVFATIVQRCHGDLEKAEYARPVLKVAAFMLKQVRAAVFVSVFSVVKASAASVVVSVFSLFLLLLLLLLLLFFLLPSCPPPFPAS
jgi:hypothetical protein